MPFEQFANNARTTLDGDLAATADTLTVTSAAGFPATAPFRIRIDDELLLVTDGAGTPIWTVTRGLETTLAAAHDDGTSVTHVLTAGAVARLKAELFRAIALRG